jgi:hypothetical protein
LLTGAALVLAPLTASARDGEGIEDIRGLRGVDGADDGDGDWDIGMFGYIRAAYEEVQDDPNFAYVGRNDGFVLHHARFGLEGSNSRYHLRWRLAMEGASDVANLINNPQAELDVRLRDAFVRYDPVDAIGIQVGQFKAPFSEEELRGAPDLLFASRAVGVEGVLPGRGQQTLGIDYDRQLGAMLSSRRPIEFGDSGLGVAYYLMVANGNGINQSLDDNGAVAFIGRAEVLYQDKVMLGVATARNGRTEGVLPNLFRERDEALAADLLIRVEGVELFGQIVRQTTSFQTVEVGDRQQLAWHVQAGYRIQAGALDLTPAYRYAYFDPFAAGGSEAQENLELVYHTFGVRLRHPEPRLGLSTYLNYTITQEHEARALNNNRFEALVQVIF